MGRLTGKTAIITGASSGIGRAAAYALAAEAQRGRDHFRFLRNGAHWAYG